MRLHHTSYLAVLGIILSVMTIGYGQTVSFQQLEQKVYRLNNELKYNESQALLLPVLQNKNFSAEDKYQAAILLSYTYKRVFDYQSTLKFLRIARQFAEETNKKDPYLATIRSEEAFVHFDRHDYQKASNLMKTLEKSDFNYISLENKSKLVTQQAYLRFLDKQYDQAEALYDRAIQLMRASTPCHLPMIFVKKMQLYNAMNRLDLLEDALSQSTLYADSCKIIKYHLYAYEELLHIYESRNDLTHIAETKKKLDSLNNIYARDENIASLHNQQENILLAEKDKEIQHEQTSKGYLAISLAGFVLVAFGLMGWLLAYHRQQHRLEIESRRMKAELESHLPLNNQVAPPGKSLIDPQRLTELSERQRRVLDCMALGMSNKQIADKLFISENTVKYHIKNIYLLLEIKDRKDFLVNIKK